jgi:hypothetical protein
MILDLYISPFSSIHYIFFSTSIYKKKNERHMIIVTGRIVDMILLCWIRNIMVPPQNQTIIEMMMIGNVWR